MNPEEIKQKKINELKEKYSHQMEEQNRRTDLENQIESALKLVLTENAKTRLYNVKLVNRELYLKTAQNLIYLYKSGQINEKIGDIQLKNLLEKLSAKREINIKRK